MFSKQSWVAVFHALQVASMPFSTVIGLVIFGMLTAPPSYQKPPETISELLSAAERKALSGDQVVNGQKTTLRLKGLWRLSSSH